MTSIICGTRDTIPIENVKRLIAEAREGGRRVVIVDQDVGLANELADIEHDLLIDPGRGNWDFYFDHPTDQDKARAAEAMIPDTGIEPRILNQAIKLFSEILSDFGWNYHAHLRDVHEHVSHIDYEMLIEHFNLEASSEDDVGRAFTICGLLHEATFRLAARDRKVPLVSIARWLASSPCAILFITAGGNVRRGACRSINAALAMIVALEAEGTTSLQHYRGAVPEGELELDPLTSIGDPLGSC